MRRASTAVLTAILLASILPLPVLAGTPQAITWGTTAPASAPVGSTYDVTATADSGLPVAITIDATSSGACTIAAGTVSFAHVGTCVIDGNQAGDGTWDPAPQVQQSMTVDQGSQTVSITSTAPVSPVVGGTYNVTAAASSGLAPTLSIDGSTTSICSIAGSLVTFNHAGTCKIDANQAGNTDWAAATQDQQSVVAGKASQTIAFTSSASGHVVGVPYTVTATGGGSGLGVTFSIDATTASACTIVGSTVTFVHASTCLIDANQAGNGDYLAAPQQQQSVTVGKGGQTVTIDTTPTTPSVGETYDPHATGGASGNPVVYSIGGGTTTHCTISTGTVSFNHIGTCTVDADQAGSSDYNAGSDTQSFTIGKGSQTVGFTSTAPVGNTILSGPYSVAATASSGLTVTFTVDASASSICNITGGNTVHLNHAGLCVIDANQAGNTDWNAAAQVQQSFTVAQASQTVSYSSSAPGSAVVNGAFYAPTATSTSGLTVTITVDASSSSVCSIAAGHVTYQAVGTCTLDANQAGNADYLAASQVQQSFAVGKGTQSINFTSTAPVNGTLLSGPYSVAATASSGLTVTFTIDASATSFCSITGGNTVHLNHAGSCVINANQAGNTDWNAAPQLQQIFTIIKANQTITFTSTKPASAVVAGAGYSPTATASSGLTVAVTVDAGASTICAMSAGTVTYQHVGTCLVDANQAGNSDWNAAPQVQQTYSVGKGSQAIAFTSTAPTPGHVSATYIVSANGGASTSPVVFSIDAGTASVCSIAGSTVTFQHIGTCTIDANQASDTNYNAAPQVQQSVTVAAAGQTISFTSTAPATAKVAGVTYTPTATATSGLGVTFSIDAAAATVCSINAGVVSFSTVGTCVVDANQAGNTDWNAAPQAQQSFAVGKGAQTITFDSIAPTAAKVAGATYDVSGHATSGLDLVFAIDGSSAGSCSISGATVTFAHVGTCVVNANQGGDANWSAAAQSQQSFAVGKGDQTITFTIANPSPVILGDHFTPTATSSSGGVVTFSIDPSSGAICTMDLANEVTFTGIGTPGCIINADQAGDTDYNAAVTTTMTIGVGDRPAVCSPTTPLAVVMNKSATGVANCTDADLQTLTYSIGTNGTNGTAVINSSTGAWTYTPNPNATGSDTFTVEANDSILRSDPATVTVTITNYFSPRNDGFTVLAAVPTVLDVTGNDAYLPNQSASGQPLTITAVTQGKLGKVTTDGTTLTYDPAGCGAGVGDTFSYSVTDGISVPVVKSVFITLARPASGTKPVTNAPVVSLVSGGTIGSTIPIKVGWCGVTAANTSIGSYRLVQSINGGTSYGSAAVLTATSKTLNASTYNYRWGVRTVDKKGLSSGYAYSLVSRILRTDSASTAIVYKGTWKIAKSSSYSGGSERYASPTSLTATYKTATTARMFGIVAARSNTRGTFRVYVDGVLVANVSERASSALYRRVLYVRALTPGVSHTIVIKPYGNGAIGIDAILTIQ